VIAAGFITGDYRRGLIRITLTVTRQRGAVLAAKALVIAGAAGTVTAGVIMFVLPSLLGAGVLGPGASGVSWLYQASPVAAFSQFGAVPRTSLVDYPYTLSMTTPSCIPHSVSRRLESL
jgi:hypothetical protein